MLLVLVFACCAKASDALLICSTLVGIVSSSQLLLLIVSCPFVVVLHSIPPSEDLLVLVYGGRVLGKHVNLLDLGVEIDLIVEPTIVLSSSLLGTVEGFPQVFGRQLTNKHLGFEELAALMVRFDGERADRGPGRAGKIANLLR